MDKINNRPIKTAVIRFRTRDSIKYKQQEFSIPQQLQQQQHIIDHCYNQLAGKYKDIVSIYLYRKKYS